MDKDVESQEEQAVHVPPDHLTSSDHTTPRSRWRCLKLMLHARRRLVLISVANRNTKIQGSLALTPPHTTDSEIAIIATPEVTLDVYSHVDGATQDVVVSAENDNQHGASNIHLQLEYINTIIKEKDLASLCEYGGAQVFAEALGTDLEKGIPEDDQHCCCRRIARETSNLQAPSKPFITFLRLLRSSNNYIVFLLLLSAFLSIGFGIKEEGLRTGWCEGVIILNAVVILLAFPLFRDLLNEILQLQEKQKLLEENEMEVDVIRGGTEKKIFNSDILLGDVVCLKRGYHIPADGLFVSDDFLELDDGSKAVVNASNPFLFYGAEVINGEGRMLVTSVGENTVWAEMMNSVCHFKRTPFEAQLDRINTWKQIVGLIISIFIIVVLFLRFELTKQQVKSGIPDIKGKPYVINEFKNVIKRIVVKPNGKISNLTTSLTMLLVGVVEGLPFCITLAIAYWSRTGMTFAQELSACVTMGSVTAVCTDRTGGLTLEPLEVDKFLIGEDEVTEELVIASHVREAIRDGISTTLLLPQALRSATDEPLLSWALFMFRTKLEALRLSCAPILHIKELIDEEGRGLLMRKNNGDIDIMCFHCTGPATKILPKCSSYFNNEGTLNYIDEQKRLLFQQIVEQMQSRHLKVIAFAYKQTVVPTIEETDLTLLGLVSLKMSIRADIKESIEAYKSAGVRIILVSGEDVETLVPIAHQFGILQENPNGQEVITGQDFRNLTDEERMKMVSGISVMGNSLPPDKHLLVNSLRKNGDSVAVIGIGTNDVPALKAADVGLAMGSWSTNVARASADIIMWDTNISVLLPVLRYGRCISNNIQKYIQLELTMLVSGLLIASITVACTGNMPITTIQSSWVNMVVPMLGGLALLTDPPLEKLMEPPSQRNESVITKAMWKNIISHAIYQATILVLFQFKGLSFLGINHKAHKTIIFNSFVLCQLFNQFNVKEVVVKNNLRAMFWVAFGVTLVLQLIFIEIAHLLAGNSRLNWAQWCICILIGMVPTAMDWAEKFIFSFIKGIIDLE
ncbi:P-type ATPase [Parasponia andersonii]|uniref:P-type ATPase n=1 Tax=Parasponia andersonii TaxID=3476 RepID=A0A2P5ABU0_PARAD|nr:P-type ATPase [Parasponia andersonii]